MEKYIGAKAFAEKCGITERRVRLLCQEGRIEGAVKLGWSWSIPADSPKPFDGRVARQFKNNFVRLGSIDVSSLNALRDRNPVEDKLYTNVNTDDLIASIIMLGSLMDGRQFSHDEILSVFSLSPARSLSFEDALRIAAFRSILLRSSGETCDYAVKTVLGMHAAFTQGYDDRNGASFKDAPSLVDGALASDIPFDFQMESFFMRFSREWKGIHPVFKSVLLLNEFIKTRPFEKDNALFALLVSCSMLVCQGFLPPYLDESMMEELNATLALARSKGNFEDLARLYERAMFDSYSRVFHLA